MGERVQSGGSGPGTTRHSHCRSYNCPGASMTAARGALRGPPEMNGSPSKSLTVFHFGHSDGAQIEGLRELDETSCSGTIHRRLPRSPEKSHNRGAGSPIDRFSLADPGSSGSGLHQLGHETREERVPGSRRFLYLHARHDPDIAWPGWPISPASINTVQAARRDESHARRQRRPK